MDDKNKTDDMKSKTRRDIWLVAGLLLAAAVSLAAVFFARSGGKAGQVVVRIDGREEGRYPLDTDREVVFETEYGRNVLVIADGRAKMTGADCPDGICMQQKAITASGETIVCLPHRLVVEGAAGDAAGDTAAGPEFDAVAS